MVEPYALPRAFETEDLATLLLGLNRKQRMVLREYVDKVEMGCLPVTNWLQSEKCPVREDDWYRRGKTARFKNSPAFQQALEAYLRAALKASAAEEVKGIAKAKRILRLGAARAAEHLVELVDTAEKDADQVKAALGVLDRADMETAAKGEVEVSDARERIERLLFQNHGGGDPEAAEERDPGGAGEAE